jgi:cbb3-type cytochrome oxidase subunit 3
MTFSSFPQQRRPGGTSERRTQPPLESPAQLAVIGLVVWLIGVLIHPLALLAPLGLLLLLLAGLAYLLRPKKRTMYWRGREIELDGDRGPVEQLYRLLFKR